MSAATTTATMSTRALDAITVIEAATMFSLPVPFDVTIRLSRLTAIVGSLADLTTWAEYMGAEVTSSFTYPDGRRLFSVDGTIAGAEVSLHAIDAGVAS